MSIVIKKFLFWNYERHVHEWKEEFREFGNIVTYSSAFLGCRELGSRPATIIYSICECGKKREETLKGRRP